MYAKKLVIVRGTAQSTKKHLKRKASMWKNIRLITIGKGLPAVVGDQLVIKIFNIEAGIDLVVGLWSWARS